MTTIFHPQADSQPAPDERDDFEKVFPLPSGCIRVGTGYASTGYSNWAAHTHCERWQGWQARAAHAQADSVPSVNAMRAALLRCIAAIERTAHCTDADRLAAADEARAAIAADRADRAARAPADSVLEDAAPSQKKGGCDD